MKLLLFDIDGTLIDTGGAGIRAMNRAFCDYTGVKDGLGRVSFAGNTDMAIIAEMFRVHIKRDSTREELGRVTRAYISNLPEELSKSPGYRVLPGVREFLEKVKDRKDIVLGLGTGNMEEGARIKLEPAGLNGYFKFGGFGSDAEKREVLLEVAVRRAEEYCSKYISKHDVFVIGDTVRDIRAGKKIDAVTVAVGAGSGKVKDLLAARPDVYLSTLENPTKFSALLNIQR